MSGEIIDLNTQLSPQDELLSAAKKVIQNEAHRYDISYEEDEADMQRLAAAIRQVEMIPDQYGWIKWDGGVCPVPPDTLVDINKPSGVRFKQTAGHYVWSRFNDKEDIVAFRYHVELKTYSGDEIIELNKGQINGKPTPQD